MRKIFWGVFTILCCLLLLAGCSKSEGSSSPAETPVGTAGSSAGDLQRPENSAAPGMTAKPDETPQTGEATAAPKPDTTAAPEETPTSTPAPTPTPEPTIPPHLDEDNYYESELSGSFGLGDTIPNFGVALCDKRVVTLNTLLKNYDCVMLAFWNSEEQTSVNELAILNEFNQKYGDSVALLCLNNMDGNKPIASFKAESGYTLAMGYDEPDAVTAFGVLVFPTVVVIDRYHVAAAVVTGSIASVDVYSRIADLFVGEDYTETRLMETVPLAVYSEEAPQVSQLSAAICPDGSMEFTSVDNEEVWPFKPDQEGVLNTNASTARSECAIQTVVEAEAGDVFAVSYTLDIPYFNDYLYLVVNNEAVTYLDGKRSGTLIYTFPEAGTYTLILLYEHGVYPSTYYANTVYLHDAVLARGEAATAFLAAHPATPAVLEGDDFYARPLTEGVQEVVPVYADGSIVESYAYYYLYLVPQDTVQCRVELGPYWNADQWYAYVAPSDKELNRCDCTEDADGFVFEMQVANAEADEYYCSQLYLLPDTQSGYSVTSMFFRDAENLEGMLETFAADEEESTGEEAEVPTWVYVDDYYAPAEDETPVLITLKDTAGRPATGLSLRLYAGALTYDFTVTGSAVVLPLKENIHYVLEITDGAEMYRIEKAKTYNVATSIGSITVTVPLT